MIRLERIGVEPPGSWAEHVSGAFDDFPVFEVESVEFEELDINHEDRRAGFKNYPPLTLSDKDKDFPPVWRTRKYVKKALRGMSLENCSYCQNPHAAGSYGDVEHYRPKSLFPTRAYSWSNYFFSCRLCNSTKSNKWPEVGEYVRPDVGDPEPRFVFQENGKVEAAPGDEAAALMIEDFGFNRKPLVTSRKNVIGPILDEIQKIVDRGLPQNLTRSLIEDKLKPSSFPYSAAVNQMIRRRLALLSR